MVVTVRASLPTPCHTVLLAVVSVIVPQPTVGVRRVNGCLLGECFGEEGGCQWRLETP